MNSKPKRTLRMLGFGLPFLLGGLFFLLTPGLNNADISAEENGMPNAMRYEVAYKRPDTLDEDKTIQQTYQGPLDLQDGDVIFTGVELWQSNSNDVWLALRFRELNSDSPTPRILLAFRDSEGVAWLSGDTFLRDPASPRGDAAMQEFWFFVTFDEEVLRRDSRNKTEWFERVANSTIEVGLVKGKEIIVAGPGNAVVDGGPPLTYLHPVATVRLFTD